MNQGQYVFSQLIEFLSFNEFNRCVDQFKGNRKVQNFTCWHQMLYMIFGQLSNRESLSDLVVCLQSQANKCYHLGMGKGTSKANLAKANENRDYRIYESFASFLVKQAQSLSIRIEEFDLPIEAPVYAIDATVIDLCLNLFWWGKFRKHKAAAKVHTMLDIKTNIPTVVFVTSGAVHEVNLLNHFPFEQGAYYLLDKGYIDFEKLYEIHKTPAFFVMGAKGNLAFVRLGSRLVDKKLAIKCDQTIRLKNYLVSHKYPEPFRRIKLYDSESKETYVFITNNFDDPAEQITELYRYRWKIELFFRWIKQHLKIKSFWGRSLNAVKTQVYIAIITYLLVAIIKETLKLKQTQYEILQILSVTLLCKTPLTELFSDNSQHYVKELQTKQLNIFD